MQQTTETLPTGQEAWQRVSALYQTHALALKKLAFLMTGDQPTAEDVVQDAFLGLAVAGRPCTTRTMPSAISDQRPQRLPAGAPRPVPGPGITLDPPADSASAEDIAILGEANSEVLVAIRRLPARQREAVVLRYYLDMTEDQAAQAMGVSRGTVKSATSRGIAALARMLKETK